MNYNLYNNILYKVDHAKYTPHNKIKIIKKVIFVTSGIKVDFF